MCIVKGTAQSCGHFPQLAHRYAFFLAQLALEDAQTVIFEIFAVGKTYRVVKRRPADTHNLGAGISLSHAASSESNPAETKLLSKSQPNFIEVLSGRAAAR